jgi:muconolactone D-isomerase
MGAIAYGCPGHTSTGTVARTPGPGRSELAAFQLKGRPDSMDFLVHIAVTLPPAMPCAEREALFSAESVRAAALADAGRLVRLWRIPGRSANWGLWRASDATELHEALTSLPLWPYMDIEVTALAKHPNDPGE